MKIRNKILFYFSTTVIAVTAFSLILIFWLFTAYREEAFQKMQFQKIKYTIGLLQEHKEQSEQISKLLDEQDIQDFYDEKLLVYDQNKTRLFSSIDSLNIENTNAILTALSPANTWIETKDGEYDIIGVYIESKGKGYYAISKAYDLSGYSKNKFLGQLMLGIFIVFVIIVLLLSRYLSNIIARPISALAKDLNNFDLSEKNIQLLTIDSNTFELQELKDKFNELLKRSHEYLIFQQNTVHHISHELKTPIAILVSELEKLKQTEKNAVRAVTIENLSQRAASLGDIVSAMLQIAKLESGQALQKEKFRTDELLFDIIESLSHIKSDFHFDINYAPEAVSETLLEINANKMLFKQAFMNLLLNAINYATETKATIIVDSKPNVLQIKIANKGAYINEKEQAFLFQYFFRGANSVNTFGFGLGLVLTQRIFAAHGATIQYTAASNQNNVFTVDLSNVMLSS